MTFPVPPAALRANDWRSLEPPSSDAFAPSIPVSIVVPYYEAPEALELTLAALEGQTYPRELFEVVIVDDGSSIPLQPPAGSPLAVRVLHQEDRGFGLARARNTGARAARHPILVFLDCDMLPEAGWLAAHARRHHLAGDLLTLGFRAHVDVAGIDRADVRDRSGTLADLFKGRRVDRPEWIEFYMARTGDLTSDADDIFRVVTGGNLGVSRWFFDQVGSFDESFDRWGMEDTEFGYRAYTLGGPLVPVRDARCWHQGEGAAPDPTERANLEFQRAKVSQLIAHPDFRPDSPGRSFTVPSFVLTVDPLDRPPETILRTVEEILGGSVHDLVVWVGDRADDEGYEWLRHQLEPDPRVSFGPLDGACERLPKSPFHIGLPAGMVCDRRMIEKLLGGLGVSAAAFGHLEDGGRLSIVRSWAVHRARRTGRRIEELGKVVALDIADLPRRRDGRPTIPRAARSSFRSRAVRVLRELIRVRSPRQAWVFSRWILAATRLRTVGFLRGRSRHSTRLSKRLESQQRTRRAQYPLGVEIAVVGSGAGAVFAASGRIHDPADGGRPDLVLADDDDRVSESGAANGPPVVILARTDPLLAVPAFDPQQMNPVNWLRGAGGRVGALGDRGLLPMEIDIHTVVDIGDHHTIPRLHHLEDTGAFHPDPTSRAATLASLAATGVLVHLNDSDPALEARLGAELYRAMHDERIRSADPGMRERISIDMRRSAHRTHSLRARARQVAGAAGLPNAAGLPEVSVLLPTRRPSLLLESLEAAGSQSYPRLELVLALHGDGFPDEIDTSGVPFPVEVVRSPSSKVFGEVLNQATTAASGRVVTKMDDDDRYGIEHVWDLVLAHEYSGAELVAKAAEFVYLTGSDRTIQRMIGGGEVLAENPTIAGGAMLIATHDLREAGGWRRIAAGVDHALARDVTRVGGAVYRTHGHGYLLVRHGDGHTWNSSDSYFLRHAQEIRPGCNLAFAGVE